MKKNGSVQKVRIRRGFSAQLFLLLIAIYSLFPVYWLVVSSTKSGASLFGSFALWFDRPTDFFENLTATLSYDNGIYLTWLQNTIFYALTAGVGATLISLFAGYAFSKFDFKGKTLAMLVVLGAVLVPYTALAVPLFLLLAEIGMVNSPWAFILPSMVNPLGVYLIKIYCDASLPNELIEAARLDGASEWRTLFKIGVPLLVPGMITVFLFTVVQTWNNFFLPLVVLTDPKLYPLTVGLASWNDQATSGGGAQILFPLVITGALIAIIPLIALFLSLQRYWQSSLALGSGK